MGLPAFDLVDGPVVADEETALGDVRLRRRGNEAGEASASPAADWTTWPLGRRPMAA